jgi:hypothetical protein
MGTPPPLVSKPPFIAPQGKPLVIRGNKPQALFEAVKPERRRIFAKRNRARKVKQGLTKHRPAFH